MHHHTQDGISLDNPQFKGRARNIASMPGLEIIILSDGVHTLAQLHYDGEAVATGHAKRKLGDKVDTELGVSIALARMFHGASEIYSHKASELLNPPDHSEELNNLPPELRELLGLPNQQEEEAIARMNKVTSAGKHEAKNAKRREARIKFFYDSANEDGLLPRNKNGEVFEQTLEEWLLSEFGDKL